MSALGARAAALAAAKMLGGATLLVRLPVPPLANTDAEELGLPTPEFRDLTVSPCVLRTRRDGSREALVDAATLETALGVTDAAAAQSSLGTAAFLQVAGSLLLLRDVEVLSVSGRAYLYRVLLREAGAEVRE